MTKNIPEKFEKSVNIWTDGGCKPNPGVGGWGVLIQGRDGEQELMGGELNTTNNRMELTAAIMALESLNVTCFVNLYTDSEYLRRGIIEWISIWKENGWKNSKKKPVLNIDLWKRLDEVSQKHFVEWHWIKSHFGYPENERVDKLATKAREQMFK